jgi:hypothetical protein
LGVGTLLSLDDVMIPGDLHQQCHAIFLPQPHRKSSSERAIVSTITNPIGQVRIRRNPANQHHALSRGFSQTR